jgi:hypothetical protein
VTDVLPPCGKAVAYYVVEVAHGRKGIMDFSNYESMRHRMDEIKKRLIAQRRLRKAAGSEHNAIKNQNHKAQ